MIQKLKEAGLKYGTKSKYQAASNTYTHCGPLSCCFGGVISVFCIIVAFILADRFFWLFFLSPIIGGAVMYALILIWGNLDEPNYEAINLFNKIEKELVQKWAMDRHSPPKQ